MSEEQYTEVMERLTDVLKGWRIDKVTWGDSETFRLYVTKNGRHRMVQIVATDLGMSLDRIDELDKKGKRLSTDYADLLDDVIMHHFWEQYILSVKKETDYYIVSCACGETWEFTKATIKRNENIEKLIQFLPLELRDVYKSWTLEEWIENINNNWGLS